MMAKYVLPNNVKWQNWKTLELLEFVKGSAWDMGQTAKVESSHSPINHADFE